MMSIVLMKILESSSNRYDKGIRLLTRGKLDSLYSDAVEEIKKDQIVLDIGCGTGNLSFLAASRESKVKAIDINPEMLRIARSKAEGINFNHPIDFMEMSIAELDNEGTETYDVVMSGLCFSELSDDEVDFALNEISRILKYNGNLIIIDESVPHSFLSKMWFYILRVPLVIITYILTQTTTHPIKELEEKIEKKGLSIISSIKNGSLHTIIASKGAK